MNWQTRWQDLESGTPIQPYAKHYINFTTEVLQKNPKVNLLEIGIYDGCSARILAECKEDYPEAKLFLVDPAIRPYARELNLPEQNIWLYEMKGEELIDIFEDETLDFIHFDMDGEPAHSYKIHQMMHELYLPKLKVGGVAVHHDWTEEYGCYQFGLDYIVNQPDKWESYIIEKHPDFPTSRPLIAIKK